MIIRNELYLDKLTLTSKSLHKVQEADLLWNAGTHRMNQSSRCFSECFGVLTSPAHSNFIPFGVHWVLEWFWLRKTIMTTNMLLSWLLKGITKLSPIILLWRRGIGRSLDYCMLSHSQVGEGSWRTNGLQLHIGWSSLGSEAVFTKKDDNDREYVIAFASRSNNKVESNYSSHEGEALTAVWINVCSATPSGGWSWRTKTMHRVFQRSTQGDKTDTDLPCGPKPKWSSYPHPLMW